MLLEKNATVTVAHSKTKNLKELALQADVIVAAVGKEKVVTADMVKPGAAVIDVGNEPQCRGQTLRRRRHRGSCKSRRVYLTGPRWCRPHDHRNASFQYGRSL